MKASRLTLQRVLERIEDGCFTAQSVGADMLEMHQVEMRDAEIRHYMKILVRLKRVEWRNQVKLNDAKCAPIKLCVPKGMAAGSDYYANRPRGDENQI